MQEEEARERQSEVKKVEAVLTFNLGHHELDELFCKPGFQVTIFANTWVPGSGSGIFSTVL